jgi:ribosomal protein S18 acetylase RimI-like enzyme
MGREMTDVIEPAPARPQAPAEQVLDRAPWQSLTGHHARFAQRHGRAARYHPDVAPFVALEDYRDPRSWKDAAALLGPEEQLILPGVSEWPDGWKAVAGVEGVQMVGAGVDPRPEPDAVVLGPGDVPEILDLVARTKPGPFLPRTIELGTYLGIRRDGALVAVAGERLHPPGWTEISAVCTDPAYRGQGLASRLVRAVAAGIVARGEVPFLHAAATNTNAIRLYRTLGFELRRTVMFTLLARA